MYKKCEAHKKRHEHLHKCLDELVADWTIHTGKIPSKNTVFKLIQWSYSQTEHPTPEKYNEPTENDSKEPA